MRDATRPTRAARLTPDARGHGSPLGGRGERERRAYAVTRERAASANREGRDSRHAVERRRNGALHATRETRVAPCSISVGLATASAECYSIDREV